MILGGNMIEMRWLVKQYMHGDERVLQYRQKYDVTIRGGAGTWTDDAIARTAHWKWSEWRDVPEIVENMNDDTIRDCIGCRNGSPKSNQ